MAIPHHQRSWIRRKVGHSATGSAAYISGTRIVDERTGKAHDYRRRHGVEHAEIVLPIGAAPWLNDRARLWNAAEAAEKRKDAVVGGKEVLALPFELAPTARLELALRYAQALSARHGCAVDYAVHAPDKSGDVRNYHLHVQITTRKAGPEGLGDKIDIQKDSAWANRKNTLVSDRELWEELANSTLAQAGVAARIDSRTLKAQQADPRPGVVVPHHAPGVHLGPAASAIERKSRLRGKQDGPASERGKIAAAHASNPVKTDMPRSIFDVLKQPAKPAARKPMAAEYQTYRVKALAALQQQLQDSRERIRELAQEQREGREALRELGMPYSLFCEMRSLQTQDHKQQRVDLRDALARQRDRVRPKRFLDWSKTWWAEQRSLAAGVVKPVSIFDRLALARKPAETLQPTLSMPSDERPSSARRPLVQQPVTGDRVGQFKQKKASTKTPPPPSPTRQDLAMAKRLADAPAIIIRPAAETRYKLLLVSKFYGNPEIQTHLLEVSPAIHWVEIDRDHKTMLLKLRGGGSVLDRGNELRAGGRGEDEISVMIVLAKEKGWTSVDLRGSDDFCARAQAALDDAGLTVNRINGQPVQPPPKPPGPGPRMG